MRRTLQPSSVVIQPRVDWDFIARVASTGRSLMTVSVTDVTGMLPLAGELAYIGTSPRHWDVGMVRIRGASGDSLSVSENEIEWSTNLYIWCPRTFAPLPRIQRVADVSGTPTVWKDTDLEPVPLPPKVNIQCSLFSSGDLSGVVSAYAFEAGASIASMDVACYPDGDVTFSLPSFYIAFPTSGYKIIVAEATDSNGQTGRMVLPVLVNITGSPDVIINEVSWSPSEGVVVRVSSPLSEPPPLAPAFIRYGSKEFLLWVLPEEDAIKAGEWRSQLTLLSSVALLDRIVSHAFVLEDGTRDSWYKVPNLTAARALHLLLEFHSTFNLTTPVYYQSARMNLPIKAQSFSEGSVLSQANDLLKDALSCLVQFGVDTLVVEEPLLLWDRSSVQRYSVTPMEIREKQPSPIGELRAGGFAYDTPYLSRYPGTTPDIWQGKEDVEGLIVSSQEDLNRISGLLYMFKTYPEVNVSIAEDLHELQVPGLWNVGGYVTGSPQRISARPSGQSFLAEATVKVETPLVAGETIIIPPPPPATPPEWPVPPMPEPPPFYSGEGLAWLLDAGYVYRSSDYYSSYPHWQQVLALGDVNPGGKPFVDFRYVERAGGVSIVVVTEDGEVVYLPDCNAEHVGPANWQTLVSKETLHNLVSSYLGEVVNPANTTVYQLMSLVHKPNYIGLVACFNNPDTHHTFVTYCFSEDWGQTWNFYSDPWWRMTVYVRKCWWLENTAGTDELIGMFGTGIFGQSSYLYRSLNRGSTWVRIGPDQGVAEPCKFRKPWQQGVSGGRMYKTGMPWGSNHHRFAVTNDMGQNWTELAPSYCGSVASGLECWTYNQNQVAVVLRDSQIHTFAFFEYLDGRLERKTDVPNGCKHPYSLEVYGNPANNREWTVLTQTGLYDADDTSILISNTLDGGLTWLDKTGTYSGFLREPRKFLLTPPFGIHQ